MTMSWLTVRGENWWRKGGGGDRKFKQLIYNDRVPENESQVEAVSHNYENYRAELRPFSRDWRMAGNMASRVCWTWWRATVSLRMKVLQGSEIKVFRYF